MQHRRRSVIAFAAEAEPPISTLNTTPLIDVMLVLLIMFIVTIPLATHKVRIDLPNGPLAEPEKPQIHDLALDAAGRLSWDGAPLAEAGLPDRLSAMKSDQP